jgi:hypothetical protein
LPVHRLAIIVHMDEPECATGSAAGRGKRAALGQTGRAGANCARWGKLRALDIV